MISHFIKRFPRKIEPAVVVLMLLYFTALNVHPVLRTLANLFSYPILFLLIIGTERPKQFSYVLTRDFFVLIILGLALVSFYWSVSPSFTLDEAKIILRSTLFGAYLTTRYTPRQQIQLFAWVLGIGAVCSLIAALVFPDYGIAFTNDQLSWRGIYSHKQYLGRMMVFATVTFLWLFLNSSKRRWLMALGIGLAVVLVVLSQSKSALILLLVSLCLVPFSRALRQPYRLRAFLLIFLFLIASSALVLVAANFETIVVDVLGKNLELNGRMPVWTLAIEQGLERPWLGHGYAGFWTSSEAYYVINNTWAAGKDPSIRFHSHNGFIDVFLDLGLVGLSLCAISFLSLLWRTTTLLSSTPHKENLWMLQFLMISFLANISDVRTMITGDTMWTLYTSIAFSTVLFLERSKREAYLAAEHPEASPALPQQ